MLAVYIPCNIFATLVSRLPDLTDAELHSLIDHPLNLSLPLSSVSVERAVKETTRAATMAATAAERDGIMQLTLRSRKTSI